MLRQSQPFPPLSFLPCSLLTIRGSESRPITPQISPSHRQKKHAAAAKRPSLSRSNLIICAQECPPQPPERAPGKAPPPREKPRLGLSALVPTETPATTAHKPNAHAGKPAPPLRQPRRVCLFTASDTTIPSQADGLIVIRTRGNGRLSFTASWGMMGWGGLMCWECGVFVEIQRYQLAQLGGRGQLCSPQAPANQGQTMCFSMKFLERRLALV